MSCPEHHSTSKCHPPRQKKTRPFLYVLRHCFMPEGVSHACQEIFFSPFSHVISDFGKLSGSKSPPFWIRQTTKRIRRCKSFALTIKWGINFTHEMRFDLTYRLYQTLTVRNRRPNSLCSRLLLSVPLPRISRRSRDI